MTIEITILQTSIILIGIGIIQFSAAEWVKSRLTKSIEHDYNKKLEEFKAQIELRKNASKIAEALSRYHYGNDKDPQGFMQLIWELSIYLPEDLVKDLTVHMVERQNQKISEKELIVRVRKLFHGKNDSVIPENLIHLSKRAPTPKRNIQIKG